MGDGKINGSFAICFLKELCHDILSHFFDGLNCGSNVRKPNNKEEKHQRVDSKAKWNKDG